MGNGAAMEEQFSSMEGVFDFAAKAAAVSIILPSMSFADCRPHAKFIYLNQCNPASIMKVGARWIQLGETFDEARETLRELIDGVSLEDWDADDRDAFEEVAGGVQTQISSTAKLAYFIGGVMITMGAILATMVILMMAGAAMLAVLTALYWAFKVLENAPYIGSACKAAAKALEAAIKVMAKVFLIGGAKGYRAGVWGALDTAVTHAAIGSAATVSAGMIFDAGVQLGAGNDNLDLADLAMESVGDIMTGWISHKENEMAGNIVGGNEMLATPLFEILGASGVSGFGTSTALDVLGIDGDSDAENAAEEEAAAAE